MIGKSLLYAVKGAIVGVGAILPGISGGVLCVAFGIYKPIMDLLTHPAKALGQHYRMLIPFLLGWAAGFVFLANGVKFTFGYAPAMSLMLFFGLICGTVPGLFQASEKNGPHKSWTPFVLALALAYLLFQILENSVSTRIAPSFLSFVLSGLLWGLSLIVPGLSSSSILIFLGLYEPLTAGIGALELSIIVPFLIGIVSTVLLFARLMTMLFEKHYTCVTQIILGFVVASALKILPASFGGYVEFLISLVCFAVGFLIAYAMERAQNKAGNESK